MTILNETIQRQLEMAGRMASQKIGKTLFREFGLTEHKILAGVKLEPPSPAELYMYAVTTGIFFKVSNSRDMSDVVVKMIPPSEEKRYQELKEFFGRLPESFLTTKPNTNKN